MKLRTIIIAAAMISAPLLRAEDLDDKGFQKLMKEIGDTSKRFRGGMESKDSAQVSKDAARLAEIHKEMAAFWKGRKADDAVKMSQDSMTAASAVAAAAKANDWERAKTELGAMMKNCKGCHDVHREKLEDGSYKIK